MAAGLRTHQPRATVLFPLKQKVLIDIFPGRIVWIVDVNGFCCCCCACKIKTNMVWITVVVRSRRGLLWRANVRSLWTVYRWRFCKWKNAFNFPSFSSFSAWNALNEFFFSRLHSARVQKSEEKNSQRPRERIEISTSKHRWHQHDTSKRSEYRNAITVIKSLGRKSSKRIPTATRDTQCDTHSRVVLTFCWAQSIRIGPRSCNVLVMKWPPPPPFMFTLPAINLSEIILKRRALQNVTIY